MNTWKINNKYLNIHYVIFKKDNFKNISRQNENNNTTYKHLQNTPKAI